MKKGKYIDIYVMMACMSVTKRKPNLQHLNELLKKVCEDWSNTKKKKTKSDFLSTGEESIFAH